jgi:hypothetical protein
MSAGLQFRWRHDARMSRTHTKIISYQKLEARGKSAVLIVKLMMACNDLQLTNEALSEWSKEQPRSRQYREKGAQIYFVRLQFAHLHEALKIVDQIRDDLGQDG